MKLIFFKSTLFSSIFLFTLDVSGQEIATDRPDQTECSSSVEKGILQIESGIILQLNEVDSNREDNLLLPTTLFRIGLHDFFELRLLVQFERNVFDTKTFNGFSDLEIGTKIQLYQRDNSPFEMAFLSQLRVPSGTKEVRNTNYAITNKICINHSFSEYFSLGYNLGYLYENKSHSHFTYSFAFNFPLSDKIGVYAEPYGFLQNCEELIANFDSGFTYLFSENLQFDFSFGLGINNSMNYWSAGISLKSKR